MKRNKLNNFYNNISISTKTGLTLIETLVAIMILLTGVILPMSIYSNSIVDSRYAGDKITAYYLAQDAIEFIKYKVNTNFNNNVSWFNGLPDCNGGDASSICTVDAFYDGICRGISCSVVLKIDNNNIYNNSFGTDTIFSRTVKFTNNPSATGTTVSSTVSWTQAGVTKSVTLEEYMFKWR